MANVITLVIIAIILGLAINKVVKEKKSGNKCIGCPHGKSCSKKSNITLNKTQVKKDK